jgi:hypothetical protein
VGPSVTEDNADSNRGLKGELIAGHVHHDCIGTIGDGGQCRLKQRPER